MERLGFYVCVRDLEDELIPGPWAPRQSSGSPKLEGASRPSEHCRNSRRGRANPSKSSFGASWAAAAAASSATRRIWSKRSIWEMPRPLTGVLDATRPRRS